MFQFGLFSELPRPFNVMYKCYSVAMLPGNERQDVERGGKIIMPPSALDHLTRLNINYPMLFKLANKRNKRVTHCGVLEFVADEGKVYLPHWMMHNMLLEEGDNVHMESVSLPVGTFSKFQPLSPDFLDITNPKAVLENCLRSFACLTTGDVIAVQYNQRIYELCVLETKPGDAISIIECDMNVEFETPVGYKEPTATKKEAPSKGMEHGSDDDGDEVADYSTDSSRFVAFTGTGVRLDGKQKKKKSSLTAMDEDDNDEEGRGYVVYDKGNSSKSKKGTKTAGGYPRGIPNYDYMVGTLRFIRRAQRRSDGVATGEEAASKWEAFSGTGFSLKPKN